jgi:hypothetical protein
VRRVARTIIPARPTHFISDKAGGEPTRFHCGLASLGKCHGIQACFGLFGEAA